MNSESIITNQAVKDSNIILKSRLELMSLAKSPLSLACIKYEIEDLKKMEDEYGLTFLHYYFSVRIDRKFHLSKIDIDELDFLIHENFDFSKQAKSNFILWQDFDDNQNYLHIEDYTYGLMTPYHIMIKLISYSPQCNFNNYQIQLLKLNSNIEDSLGLTAFIYALNDHWVDYLAFLEFNNLPLLTEKLKLKKDYIINLINKKLPHPEDNPELYQLFSILQAKIEKECLNELFISNDEHLKEKKMIKI